MDAPSISPWKDFGDFIDELDRRRTTTIPKKERIQNLYKQYRSLVEFFRTEMDSSYISDRPNSQKVKQFFATHTSTSPYFDNFDLKDYNRLVQCIIKTNLFASSFLLKRNVECITECGNTADLALLLRQFNTTASQYVLSYLRQVDVNCKLLQQFFQFYTVSLDPNELTLEDYKKLFELEIDLNSPRNFHPLPIVHAVQTNNETLFQHLITYRANPMVLLTPLNWPQTQTYLQQRRPDLISCEKAFIYLLDLINFKPINNCEFEHHACYILLTQTNDFELFMPPLQAWGFTVNHQRGDETMLTTLLKNPPPDVLAKVQKLIQVGVPVDANFSGLTLKRAMKKQLWDVVKLLVEKGANPNHVEDDQNPVKYALVTRDTAFMEVLCAAKVDFSKLKGPNNENALDWAILNRSPCLPILMNHIQLFCNLTDWAIHCAFRTEQPELMLKLWELGAPSHHCFNAKGQTPLTILFHRKDLAAFEASIAKDYDSIGKRITYPIDIVNGRNETCLLTMLSEDPSAENERFIRAALQYHPNWYIKNSQGITPLQIALKNYPHLVENLFVDFDSILDLDSSGQCVMDVAFAYNRKKFLRNVWNHVASDLGVPADSIRDLTKDKLSCILHDIVSRSPEKLEKCITLAFQFNVIPFTLKIQNKISQDQFVEICGKILALYPGASVRYWLNHVVYFNPKHLEIEAVDTRIPQAPVDVEYQLLHQHFLTLNLPPEVITRGTKLSLEEFKLGVKRFFLHLEMSLNSTKVAQMQIILEKMKTHESFKPKKIKGRRISADHIPTYSAERFREAMTEVFLDEEFIEEILDLSKQQATDESEKSKKEAEEFNKAVRKQNFRNGVLQISSNAKFKEELLKITNNDDYQNKIKEIFSNPDFKKQILESEDIEFEVLISEFFARYSIEESFKNLLNILADIRVPLTLAQAQQVANGEVIIPEVSLSYWHNLFKERFEFYLKANQIADPDVFYPEVINNLRHLLLEYNTRLEKGDALSCETLLLELGLIANECSNRWKTGTHEQYTIYRAITPNIDLFTYMIHKYNQLRLAIAKELAGGESHSVTQVYSLLANKVKLWGVDSFVDYNDFIKKPIDEVQLLKRFSTAYYPGLMCQYGQTVLQEHMKDEKNTQGEYARLSVLDWFEKHLMLASQDELFSDKENYTLTLGKTIYLLVHMQIVSEVQAGTAERILTKIDQRYEDDFGHDDKKRRATPNQGV